MKGSAGNGSVVKLGDIKSTDISVVGGKGASLGKMARAGFPVPSGFVVTTEGYAGFIRANKLDDVIKNVLKGIDYGNLDEVEKQTGKIRQAIIGGTIPESLSGVIVKAYSGLGDKPYVAVRSSGTAEDLEGASFAGQYETFLDIRGEEALLEAVKKCWASMWTARVVAYRHNKGLEKAATGIAVVVQMMVEAEVAGVMFVGNPMNARADETVINASWGLGEMVVSGSVTPDEYVLGRDLKVKRRQMGSKELRVFRNKKAGKGTVKEAVPAKLREQYTLTDEEAGKLGEMGRKVNDYYGGLPQDIEWARKDGSFYLLQSRPITGVEFTWEEDLDLWPFVPEDSDDTIWTRSWSDMFWHGAITPLFWEVRGTWMRLLGAGLGQGPGVFGDRGKLRWLKYHAGTVYYNTRVTELMVGCVPPILRSTMLQELHPSQLDKVMNTPFELEKSALLTYINETKASIEFDRAFPGIRPPPKTKPQAFVRSLVKGGANYELRRAGKINIYPLDPDFYKARPDMKLLRSLGDEEIYKRVDYIVQGMGRLLGLTAEEEGERPFPYRIFVVPLLDYIVKYWYTGSNPNVFVELISGLPERTQQFHDDYDFWKLADTIRRSEVLLALLKKHEGATFFEELKNHEEGRAWLAQYEEFLDTNGCRGQADRDIYYARRIEDPNIDYVALRLLATAKTSVSPEEREEKMRKRRETTTAEVIENLATQPMGAFKVDFFKYLMNLQLAQLLWRDDERPMADPMTWSKKVLLSELGRRAVERGLLEGKDDFYFLSFRELRELLAGKHSKELARAKATARRKPFERFLTHEVNPPMFLKGNVPMQSDEAPPAVSGAVLKGKGTSPGTVTGRAKIIPVLKDIGRLEKGDILVCNSTDPGWTSAFSIVSGVVAETGGMTAHFSCLSREYGLPAISLPDAMKLIKDGSTVTVDGDSGEVRL